jgi:hypothetical protein
MELFISRVRLFFFIIFLFLFDTIQNNAQLRTRSYGIDRHVPMNCRKQILIVDSLRIQWEYGINGSMVELLMEAVTNERYFLFRGLRILLDDEV